MEIISIEILPKIYGCRSGGRIQQRSILIRMLAKAPDASSSTKRVRTQTISSETQPSRRVHSAFLRSSYTLRLKQGAIRKYVKREKNLNVLRGRLLTERQFKFNLAHRERLFCRYDELSEDNLYNQILKFVLEYC